MTLLFDLLAPIYSALTFSFTAVQKVFASLGFPWLAAVSMMVLVSVVLRLFTARFIGSAIAFARSERSTARAAADAKRSAIRAKEERAATERLRINSGKEIL